MSLSRLPSVAFRPSGCGVRSASSCISSRMGERRPLGNHHAVSKSTVQTLQRPFLSTPLFSSAIRENSNDASIPSPLSQKPSTSDDTNNQDGSSWSNYERLVRQLYMTNLFNPVKLGLENMDLLHKALGSPMDQVCVYYVYL